MDAIISAQEPQNKSDHNRSPDRQATLGSDELRRMNAYWRAANYLSVGQIYLYDNPLLKEPLKLSHVKPLVVGHWGTTPGQNFIYVHLNRVIKQYDLDMFYIAGPGHGGPATRRATPIWRARTARVYPNISQDEAGLKKLFTQFSFPGRNLQSRGSDDTRFDSRRRRAGVFAQPCLRSRLRQSPSDRGLHRRRRRSRNGPSRDRMAVQRSCSARSAMAPCCRSCTSMATRSATPPSWPASSMRNWSSSSGAVAGRPLLRGGRSSPRRCTDSWLGPWIRAIEEIRQHPKQTHAISK